MDKILGIVFTDIKDDVRELPPSDDTSNKIATHLINFFHQEVMKNRLPKNLLPLQSGVGGTANAI